MRAVIALAVMIGFGYSITGQFVGWDDQDLIVGNAKLNPPTLHGFAEIWRGPDHQMYIPVVYSAWWGLAHFGMRPAVFHAANLIMHLLSAWVVLEILLLLFRVRWAACAGAILFAVHPLQTEPVAWATGMKDCLSGLLALLVVWQYLKAQCDNSVARYAIASGVFVLALLAKPSTVVVPAICAVLDYLILRSPWRRILIWQGPWVVIAFACTFVASKVQPIPANLRSIPPPSRLFVAADATCWYLMKFVWPTGLVVEYSRGPAKVLLMGWGPYEMLIIAGLAAGLGMIRRPALTAAAMVFVIGLLPVLGLTPFAFQRYSTVADRYAYLALLGPAIACAWLLQGVDPRRWLSPAAIVAALLVFMSLRQTMVWHDTLTLFSHTLELNPTSLAATRSLGFYWAEHHDDAQAAAYYDLAERTHPEDSTNHFNYANLLRRNGLIDRAIGQYQAAIAIDPRNAQYQLNYGVALATANRDDEALAAFQAAAAIDPASADAWQNAGLMLEKLGRLDEARQAFTRALQLDRFRPIPRQHLNRLDQSR